MDLGGIAFGKPLNREVELPMDAKVTLFAQRARWMQSQPIRLGGIELVVGDFAYGNYPLGRC